MGREGLLKPSTFRLFADHLGIARRKQRLKPASTAKNAAECRRGAALTSWRLIRGGRRYRLRGTPAPSKACCPRSLSEPMASFPSARRRRARCLTARVDHARFEAYHRKSFRRSFLRPIPAQLRLIVEAVARLRSPLISIWRGHDRAAVSAPRVENLRRRSRRPPIAQR